mmetsp:Transcript_30998/g.74923  ORF Transcript_30998/g.74923 Transcript_30998/m.74923 type:complete len:83 (+) Transcript_30998:107-355(+)
MLMISPNNGTHSRLPYETGKIEQTSNTQPGLLPYELGKSNKVVIHNQVYTSPMSSSSFFRSLSLNRSVEKSPVSSNSALMAS